MRELFVAWKLGSHQAFESTSMTRYWIGQPGDTANWINSWFSTLGILSLIHKLVMLLCFKTEHNILNNSLSGTLPWTYSPISTNPPYFSSISVSMQHMGLMSTWASASISAFEMGFWIFSFLRVWTPASNLTNDCNIWFSQDVPSNLRYSNKHACNDDVVDIAAFFWILAINFQRKLGFLKS